MRSKHEKDDDDTQMRHTGTVSKAGVFGSVGFTKGLHRWIIHAESPMGRSAYGVAVKEHVEDDDDIDHEDDDDDDTPYW